MMKRLWILGVVLALASGMAQDKAPKADPTEEELGARFDALANRANAALESLKQFEERLKNQGLSLRYDIVLSRVRLESSMDSAEKELREKHFEAVRRALDRAQGAVEKLEAFLRGD